MSEPTLSSDAPPLIDAFAAPTPDRAPGDLGGAANTVHDAQDALVVDVAGFEGPLDLLLALARTQKVDIAKISITALVDQYLKFIGELQDKRIEVAADYLVIAAWLAFLKSRLLLPKEQDDEAQETAEVLAAKLAFRLQRLDAMRQAAARLFNRPRLGQQTFARGKPEAIETIRETRFTAELIDLLKAYAHQRQRTEVVPHVVKRRTVWSIKDARQRLEKLVGSMPGDWVQLDLFLERYVPSPAERRTVRASSFGATLEMAREGTLEIQQDAPFAPLYLRHRSRTDTPSST